MGTNNWKSRNKKFLSKFELVGYCILVLKQLRLGVVLWLAFTFFLRTTEFLSLTKQGISFDENSGIIVLNLGLTKSGRRLGLHEGVTLKHKGLARLLSLAVQHLGPDDKLLNISDYQFRRIFGGLLSKFDLSDVLYKPCSLRRGGATHMMSTCNDLQRVQIIGRWSDAKTARVYVQEAMAAKAVISQTKSQKALFKKYDDLLSELLS